MAVDACKAICAQRGRVRSGDIEKFGACGDRRAQRSAVMKLMQLRRSNLPRSLQRNQYRDLADCSLRVRLKLRANRLANTTWGQGWP